MSRYEEFMSSLPPVTSKGQESQEARHHVASLLASTDVPAEHAQSLSGIHTGAKLPQGQRAQFSHESNSIFIAGDPGKLQESMPKVYDSLKRTVTHELGHARSYAMSPGQFSSKNLQSPSFRGREEATAENYADQYLPGSYSTYDYSVPKGQNNLDKDEYKKSRGQRFGNVDPRLR